VSSVAVLTELKEWLESTQQKKLPLFGRLCYLFGFVLLELKRASEALAQLEEALVFFEAANDHEGKARVLILYRAAQDTAGCCFGFVRFCL
jgi:hypothetical protein